LEGRVLRKAEGYKMTNLPYACTDLDRTFSTFALIESLNKINELEKEIASLKGQLKREMAAVDFYADRENWLHPTEADEYCQMNEYDEEGIYKGSRFIGHYSGKLARATQARRERSE